MAGENGLAQMTLEQVETPASNRALPLGLRFRGKRGTVVRMRRTQLPRDTRTHYCVEWQTLAMSAPAFWYYTDRVEANTDALKLLGEWFEIPNSA